MCTRLAAPGSAHGTAKARFNRLVDDGAWLDAVLMLLDLELPRGRLRRALYDAGEWHCFLSKQPEVPLELDDGIEAAHEVLALAILKAFVKARGSILSTATSVPQARAGPNCITCCDNFC